MKNDIILLQEAAQEFAAKGEFDKAIATWKKLLTVRQDGNIYNIIGDLYFKKGSPKEAVEFFTIAANKFRNDGFQQKALALYKKILNIAPDDIETLIGVAELYAAQGFENLAIESFLSVSELHIKNNAVANALEIYEKILRLFPFNINIRIKLSELYIKIGLKERAAQGYTAIAASYLEKDDPQRAQEFYLRAIEIDPNNISALTGLSELAESLNDFDKALEYLSHAMSSDSANNNLLLNYARLAIKANRIDEHTKDILLKFIESHPDNTQARQYLGTIYLAEDLPEKAWNEFQPCIDEKVREEAWAEALELLNRFKELFAVPVTERLINIYRAKGDREQLIAELQKLANFYKSENSFQEALHLYKELHELNPDDVITAGMIAELEHILEDLSLTSETMASDISAEDFNIETVQIQEPHEPAMSEEFQEKKLEADFYAEQGLKEEALKIYERLLSAAPDNSEIINRIEALRFIQETETVVIQEYEPAMSEEFQEKKLEADFYAEQGLKEEALKIYERLLSAAPDNSEIINRIEAMRHLPEIESPDNSLQLDTEQNDTITETLLEEAQVSPTDAFEIKTASSEAGSDEEDNESPYNSGVEFKSRGLLDDAIREFQIASGDPEKMLLSLRMLALCYIEKKDYSAAIEEFNKLIQLSSSSDKRCLDIKYELADAYMKNNDFNMALKIYSDIYAEDPKFKDVSQKYGLLKIQLNRSLKKIKNKKDKISYL